MIVRILIIAAVLLFLIFWVRALLDLFTHRHDLSVGAKILHSDGNVFALHVTATDATGFTWLDKDYEMSTAAGAFNRQRYPDLDPYQDVFNGIANDLAAVRETLSRKDNETIRTVSALRYASEL